MAESYQAEQRARIRRADPRASEDSHDEALGESYFAEMMSNSSYCDSPEQLREFLNRFRAGNVQFHSAFDARVARRAFRQMARQLIKRAESAIV